jgi:hypothetical protein
VLTKGEGERFVLTYAYMATGYKAKGISRDLFIAKKNGAAIKSGCAE